MIKSENMIIVPENVLKDMCILEDDLPREGSIQPDSTVTMMVCVDGFKLGLVFGRVYSCYMDEPRSFRSLDQMLFIIDERLDLAGKPMRDTQLRGKSSCISLEKKNYSSDPPRSNLRITRGKMASFYIRVYSRKYTSMQGVVAWIEKEMRPEAFRSEMELMSLIYSTLNKLNH
ncbi:hypothetical protein INF37_15235 [Pseudoflavonifractor sp. DSM 107456]|uniref:Uncharacterized protein n=1 Tax=Pseudoflavonifractor gallinarum TaxID=2779352 RepID=A0ABR9RFJ7_9FIRM|nr:hypothetical protein [Pseudoflavonifractor gallinarum]MBE5057328.1 hypothetical protein [Pseudoflavonifractor gallinarum]